MAYVAVDPNGEEWIYEDEPIRYIEYSKWYPEIISSCRYIQIPKGTIEKLIGKKLTWEDEPVELKEET